ERRARQAENAPLVHRYRAQTAVEPDGGLVPVEDRPLEPRAAPLERGTCEVGEQLPADPPAARLRANEQILQIDSWPSLEGGEIVEEEREAERLPVAASEHDFGIAALAEEGLAEVGFGGGDLVLQMLVARKLADEFEYQGNIAQGSRPDGDGFFHVAHSSGDALQSLRNAAGAREQRIEEITVGAAAGTPALEQVHLHEVHRIDVGAAQPDG